MCVACNKPREVKPGTSILGGGGGEPFGGNLEPATGAQIESAAGRSAAPRVAAAPVATTYAPARFPWRFMLGMAAVGIVFVVVGHQFTDPGEPTRPDGLLQAGSCVALGVDASEVVCDGRQDAVVQVLVPSDQTCPTGTESFRDRQGMGTACVVRLAPGS